MATVLLIRHGRTTANSAGTLAGWTPGVFLDEVGQEQVATLGARIASVPLSAVVSSPLERCRQTTTAVLGDRDVPAHHDEDVAEVRYGDWTGESLKVLAKQPLWKVVQQHPSNATFPGDGGESLAGMQARAVAAVRRWNTTLGADATYAVVSHGDVIKAVLADALGMHLDLFQRIVVDPASLSVVQYGDTRAFVERTNDSGGDVSSLLPPKRRRKSSKRDDAAVGGGAGPGPRTSKKR
ncbi:MAG: MSMEG_4193 family putative phosphomutase [Actinomycetia bacterium]|nr:MSMEG_4193 family putative phosphomutase [Actinomycetes bacterium]